MTPDDDVKQFLANLAARNQENVDSAPSTLGMFDSSDAQSRLERATSQDNILSMEAAADPDELVRIEDIEIRDAIDTVVQGCRPGVVVILSGIVICGLLMLSVLFGDAGWLACGLLLLIVPGVVLQLQLLLRPPRVEIESGRFQLRHHRTYATSVQNVADFWLDRGMAAVRFYDVEDVEPMARREMLRRQFERTGAHLKFTRSVFSVDQVRQIRRGLGLRPDASRQEAACFEERLHQTTPHVLVTPMLLTLNLMMFAIIVVAGGGILIPDVDVMVNLGANYGPLTANGQSWRLLTSMFLHFGVFHLLFNMWILRDIGSLVERIIGNLGFLVGYLVSGAVGGTASVLWHGGEVVSAGASGAIFGIFGMLLGFLMVRRSSIPMSIVSEHRNQALAFVVFNLLFGLSVTWVDNAAHLGGLLAGFACGVSLNRKLMPERLGWQVARSALVAVTGVAAIGAAMNMAPLPRFDSSDPPVSSAPQTDHTPD